MLGNKPDWLPVVLTMASFTFQAHGRGMRVWMATSAAAGQIDCHRATIIMTTQTGGFGVRSFQSIPGFFLVIKGKTVA